MPLDPALDFGPGENLSSMAQLPKLHTLLVLTAGGLVVGLTDLN